MKRIAAHTFYLFGNELSVKTIISHPFFAGSFVMIGGSMAANVINYFYHLVMGRQLGPEGYGTLASVYSIIYLVGIIPLSASFTIVKFVSSAKNENEQASIYHSVKKAVNYMALVSMILIVVLSPMISSFLNIEEVLSVAFVGPILFFILITLVNKATLQGILKFYGVVIPDVISSIVKLILGLLFLAIGLGVVGVVGAIIIAALLSYLASLKYMPKMKAKKKVEVFDYRPILKYSLPVLLQAMSFTALFTVDIIIVKHFLPAFEAGIYAALATLGKIIYFAAQPVTSVMFPVVSKRRSIGEDYRKVFYMTSFVTIAISLIIVAFYSVFPNLAIGVLYGEEYLIATKELSLMGIFISVYTLCYMLVNFILSLNKTRIVILPILTALLQGIALWRWHDSVRQVIQINTLLVSMMLGGLLFYLSYNEFVKIKYAKRK